MKLFYKIFFLLSISLGFASVGVHAQSNEQRVFSNNTEKKLTAYPIPANNILFFKLSAALKSEAKTVELVSVIGRTVAVQRVSANSDDDIMFNNLSQLPEGVYIGVTKDANGKILQSTKLIIQR